MLLEIRLEFYRTGAIKCEIWKEYSKKEYRISNHSAVRMAEIMKRLEERTGNLVVWDVHFFPDFVWQGNYHKGDSNE